MSRWLVSIGHTFNAKKCLQSEWQYEWHVFDKFVSKYAKTSIHFHNNHTNDLYDNYLQLLSNLPNLQTIKLYNNSLYANPNPKPQTLSINDYIKNWPKIKTIVIHGKNYI